MMIVKSPGLHDAVVKLTFLVSLSLFLDPLFRSLVVDRPFLTQPVGYVHLGHLHRQVWTNTCCSHPLHGMEPPEVDTPEDVAGGTVLGAKYAAIRKLDHELGIPNAELPVARFKFLTRLHYWAADTVTHGPERYGV
jgi:hypothetical protein